MLNIYAAVWAQLQLHCVFVVSGMSDDAMKHLLEKAKFRKERANQIGTTSPIDRSRTLILGEEPLSGSSSECLEPDTSSTTASSSPADHHTGQV